MQSAGDRQHSVQRSGVLPAPAPYPWASTELQPHEAQSLMWQKGLRRRVRGDRRGHRRTLSDPGPVFPGTWPSRQHRTDHSAAKDVDLHGEDPEQTCGGHAPPGAYGSPNGKTHSARALDSAGQLARHGAGYLGSQTPVRHSLDVLCTPPRAPTTRSPPRTASPASGCVPAPPCAAAGVAPRPPSSAAPPLPHGAHGKRGPLPAALPPPLRWPSGAAPSVAGGSPDREGAATAGGTCGHAPAGPRRGRKPIVFLHGVGFGVFPYLGFVWKLLRAFPGSSSGARARAHRAPKCIVIALLHGLGALVRSRSAPIGGIHCGMCLCSGA